MLLCHWLLTLTLRVQGGNNNVHEPTRVSFFDREGDGAPGRVVAVAAGNQCSFFLTGALIPLSTMHVQYARRCR